MILFPYLIMMKTSILLVFVAIWATPAAQLCAIIV